MMMRAQTNIHIAINRRVRERPGSLILAEQPSKRSSGALLHLEFYAAETFHQIEELAIGLDRIDRGAALLPGAPGLSVDDAPVSLGGRLGHATLPALDPAGRRFGSPGF